MSYLVLFLHLIKWGVTIGILTFVLAVVLKQFFPVRLIGLTGSIACGKSTAAKMIKNLNPRVHVIDFDRLGHQALDPGTTAWAEIRREYGEGVLNKDWTVDRKKLGELCFKDRSKLRRLSSLTKPLILMQFLREMALQIYHRRRRIFVLDAPLLFESGLNWICDTTIAVSVDESMQLARLVSRDNCEIELAKRKIKAQLPSKEKASRAETVLNNNGGFDALRKQVVEMLTKPPFALPSSGSGADAKPLDKKSSALFDLDLVAELKNPDLLRVPLFLALIGATLACQVAFAPGWFAFSVTTLAFCVLELYKKTS